MSIPNENKQNELKFAVGNICLSIKIKHPGTIRKIKTHYNDFISNQTPDLYINVEYKNIVTPHRRTPLLETRSWRVYKEKGCFIFSFPRRNISSIAQLNKKLNRIKFYTKDPSYQLLLYLFPEILFSLILPKYYGLMLHACGVIHRGKGYLFIAADGGGKSTIAKLSEGKVVLNDDRILIRKQEGRFIMYGTPWHGEFKRVSKVSVPISKVFFLRKAKHNYIFSLTSKQAMIKFLNNVIYLPVSEGIRRKVFELCSQMAKQLECHILGFVPKKNIWRFIDDSSQ